MRPTGSDPRPRALLDEDVRLALVAGLVSRGFDVVSVHQVGPKSADDVLVLQRAIELERVLITHNTEDFKVIHAAFQRQGSPHPGIIGLPQPGSLRRRILRAAMMLDWLGTQPYTTRMFLWGQLQQLIERGYHLPGYTVDEVREVLGRI